MALQPGTNDSARKMQDCWQIKTLPNMANRLFILVKDFFSVGTRIPKVYLYLVYLPKVKVY